MNATISKPFLTRRRAHGVDGKLAAAAAICCAFLFNFNAPAQAGDMNITTIGNQQIRTADRNPVFFVTDRKETIEGDKVRFVDGRSSKLNYGISYPDADSDNKIKTLVFDNADQFYAELAKYDKGEPICFLHGYHRNFKTSVQLGFETAKGLNRPIVLFSWPTRNSYVKYFVDETNAEWAGPHFAAFLNELGNHVPSRNITLIAHSVGAKVITSAFQTLALNRSSSDLPKFGKVLMCSPDIDRDIFVEQAPLVKLFGSDVRIYVSARDKRIALSNFFHGGYRIGSATKLRNIEGIEIVNFEAEDKGRFGHSIPYALLSRALKSEVAASAEHTSTKSFQPLVP